MTTAVLHCNTAYVYHPSYYGTRGSDFNNKDYCEECYKIICKSLNKIPIKFEKKWILTNDYTKEQIIEKREERIKNSQNDDKNCLPIFRISPGLFDLKNPENKHNKIMEMMEDPISKEMLYYSLSYWINDITKEESKIEIRKEVWWDIENNCVSNEQRNFLKGF